MRALQSEIERRAKTMGVGFFGAGDLAPVQEPIVGQGGEFLGALFSVICSGLGLAVGIVDELARHKERIAGRA